jgi:hypothetical protein
VEEKARVRVECTFDALPVLVRKPVLLLLGGHPLTLPSFMNDDNIVVLIPEDTEGYAARCLHAVFLIQLPYGYQQS